MKTALTKPASSIPLLLLGGFIALCLQVIAIGVMLSPWATADTPIYKQLGDALTVGQYGLPSLHYAPDVLRPPGYPLVMALTLGFGGLPDAALVAIQLALYVAAIALVVQRSAECDLNPVYVIAIAIVYPFGSVYAARLGVEGWIIPAYTALAYLITSIKMTYAKAITVGILAGLLILLRSDMLLLPLVAAFILVCLAGGGGSKIAKAGYATVLMFSAALTLLPYSIWNLANHGRFQPTPVAAAVGSSLYTASWQEDLSHEDFNAIHVGRVTPAAVEKGLVDEMRRLNRSIGAPEATAPFNPAAYATPETQAKANLVFGEAALERISARPLVYLEHVVENVWELWNTQEYPTGLPALVKFALTVVSALVTIFGYVGIAISLRLFSTQPRLASAALLTLYPLAVHLPLHTEARYTAGVRPLFIFFAGAALFWAVAYLRRLRERLVE